MAAISGSANPVTRLSCDYAIASLPQMTCYSEYDMGLRPTNDESPFHLSFRGGRSADRRGICFCVKNRKKQIPRCARNNRLGLSFPWVGRRPMNTPRNDRLVDFQGSEAQRSEPALSEAMNLLVSCVLGPFSVKKAYRQSLLTSVYPEPQQPADCSARFQVSDGTAALRLRIVRLRDTSRRDN
jgi:hypothetical protein